MFHFYFLLSSNVQNCISKLEKISHFVFYIIRFIISGDTRLYKISNISTLSQSKIESTSSSFITFHLCAFCIGILFGASAHLFNCNLHHWSPSSVAPGHKLTALPCCLGCLSRLSALQNVKQTNISSSTLHCNNPCIFTVYSPKCILYYTFVSIEFIRQLAVLSRSHYNDLIKKMEQTHSKHS